jgi:hypothetical protein
VKAEYGDKRFGVKGKKEKIARCRDRRNPGAPSSLLKSYFAHHLECVAAAEVAARQRIN